ncbi:MAG: hypothetical protein IJI06_00015 [Oscillospiraceae bacterium]|nr:hypothetical protein [Oscillospiraceae bacterium]
MNNSRRLIHSAAEIVIGAVLLITVRLMDGDSIWLGMGGALIAVGALQLFLGLRYRMDAEYRERTDTEATDERNQFIRSRAWVWASTGFVLIGGVMTIVFQILGRQELSTLCGTGVSLLVLLYWLSYLVLKKKY